MDEDEDDQMCSTSGWDSVKCPESIPPDGCQVKRELGDSLGLAFSTTAVASYTDTSSIINFLANPVKRSKTLTSHCREKRSREKENLVYTSRTTLASLCV